MASVEHDIKSCFGFVADPSLTAVQNASAIVGNMPAWLYFCRPSNVAFHDRSKGAAPSSARALLGLGLNFCLQTAATNGRRDIDILRFYRDLLIRFHFAGRTLLKEELFVKSDWWPKPSCLGHEAASRYKNFKNGLKRLFQKQKSPTNLLSIQQTALQHLRYRKDLVVWRSDKNLGPIVTTENMYVKRALNDHRLDPETYRRIPSKAKLDEEMEKTRLLIVTWYMRWMPTGPGRRKNGLRVYIERNLEKNNRPVYFYITAKIHKSPASTRPIVSSVGSMTHAIARWVDRQLQRIVRLLPFVITSSDQMLRQLRRLDNINEHSRILTFDARLMYTKIETGPAILRIHTWICENARRIHTLGIQGEKLIGALQIVMNRNVFEFDDTYWMQISGTAMGTPPAPTYATLYFAISELKIVPRFPELSYYGRLIDDGIAIWTPRTSWDNQ